MRAYYNEHDANAAAWLRELIKAKQITDGEVDERSIEDVLPADVRRFDRCHFFAGIGVWDHALNLAGWPDDRRVWTGSCPCQPFSAAGKGEGFADERHLWPAWFHLQRECRPDTIFGEQVASKDGLTWFDLVSSDLEGIGYRIGAADIPVAGVGAPHIRQRLFFVADADGGDSGTEWQQRGGQHGQQPQNRRPNDALGKDTSRIGRRGWSDGDQAGSERALQIEGLGSRGELENSTGDGWRKGWPEPNGIERRPDAALGGSVIELEYAELRRREQRATRERSVQKSDAGRPTDGLDNPNGQRRQEQRHGFADGQEQPRVELPGLTNGFWHDAEWIYCRDGKYRPTKPGIFPLADGTTGRVALLRGAGNAISPQVAQAFIESYLETL